MIMKILFIGNSATFVHEIPQKLQRLCEKAGYKIETNQLTPRSFYLREHADETSEHGKQVLEEIKKGYDIVFLQENSTCIVTEEKKEACRKASEKLIAKIKESDAKPVFYVRPPTGKDLYGIPSLTQCMEYDKLFNEIADKNGLSSVYVNRSFGYAIKNLNYNLWGDDNAHVSEYGAYLIACTFFATLFDTSSTVLDSDGLSDSDARALQQAADKIALEKYIPWNN